MREANRRYAMKLNAGGSAFEDPEKIYLLYLGSQNEIGGDGPNESEAHVKEMGLTEILEREEIISPLKDIVAGPQLGQRNGLRGGLRIFLTSSQSLEKQINKSLEVRKKIGHSPFRGSRIHKHAAFPRGDSVKGSDVLSDVIHLSSLKMVPYIGKNLKKSKGPVVKEKPPADA